MDAFPIVAYSFTNKNDDLKPQQKKLMTNLFLNYKQLMAFRMLNLMVKQQRQVTLKFKQNKLDEAGLTVDDVENYIKTATRETPLDYFNLEK